MMRAIISYWLILELCLVRLDTVWSILLSVGLIGFWCSTTLDGARLDSYAAQFNKRSMVDQSGKVLVRNSDGVKPIPAPAAITIG